jgi:hypothetical protein
MSALVPTEELPTPHSFLLVTPDLYRTDERLRGIADRVLAALDIHPGKVAQLRIYRETIEVDLHRWDPRLGQKVTRTARYSNGGGG